MKPMTFSPKPDGVVFYRGPSMLDGKPIVAIATGLRRGSENTKTGDMVQTYILREDIAPTDAVHSGEDVSICGDCPLRGSVKDGQNQERACYVTVFMGPQTVWKAYRRGNYPNAGDLSRTFAGKLVRVGAYGDPAAVPLSIWQAVLSRTKGHTGYTHQWRKFPEFAAIIMASVESREDKRLAQGNGFRTFRVTKGKARQERDKDEFVCPASDEMPNKIQCEDCGACGGQASPNKASVVIAVHGSTAKINAFQALA